MSHRYVTLPKPPKAAMPYYDGDEYLHTPDLRVFEDNDPRPTGLFDARGNEFYRLPERGKLGF